MFDFGIWESDEILIPGGYFYVVFKCGCSGDITETGKWAIKRGDHDRNYYCPEIW